MPIACLSLADSLEFRTAYNRFGGYCLPLASAHRPASQTIQRGDVWEANTIDFIREHARGRGVLHAGAYFGDFLPALSQAASHVWSFEPSLENYRCSALTVGLNRLSNVTLAHGALSNVEGELDLATQAAAGVALCGSSRIVRGREGTTEHVRALTIDLECAGADLALMHLDLEGHEEAALHGALRTIRRCRPILILETAPAAWIDRHLAPLGYRQGPRLDENTVFQI